jgi:exosortase A
MNTTSAASAQANASVPRGTRIAYLAAVAGLIAIPLIFIDAAMSMFSTWMNSSTFNHGPLIPALAIYLAWRRRDHVAAVPTRFEWTGLVAVAGAIGVWLVGRLSETTVIQQFALVFTMQAFIFCVLGRHVFWQLLFPCFYLIFAVPFGAELVPPLQNITAFFVVTLLRLAGVPVFIDGVFIATPAGNYLVAEACAGLRYLISTVALGLVFANLTFSSWQRRTIFMGLSLFVPIIANGIRAFLIVFVAYLSNNEIAAGIDHIIYGWVFFTFVTFLLFGVGYAMREPLDEDDVPRPVGEGGAWTGSVAGAGATVVLALAALIFAESATARTTPIDSAVVPPEFAGFWKAPSRPNEWAPVFAGADLQLDQAYERNGVRFGFHVGVYAHERQGATAVTVEHRFEPSSAWKSGAPKRLETSTPDGPISVTAVPVSSAGYYRVIWYWYWVGGEFTGSPYVAKLLRLRSLLTGGNVATAVVGVSAEYPAALGEPTDLLREMAAATPAIKAMLERATSGRAVAARGR